MMNILHFSKPLSIITLSTPYCASTSYKKKKQTSLIKYVAIIQNRLELHSAKELTLHTCHHPTLYVIRVFNVICNRRQVASFESADSSKLLTSFGHF